MNAQPIDYRETESYRDGKHFGKLDAAYGTCLRASVTSTWGHYAVGYMDGQIEWRLGNKNLTD